MENKKKYSSHPPIKYPLNGRLSSQIELYAVLSNPSMDRTAMTYDIESIVLGLEEKAAPQCAVLQSALELQLLTR